MGRSGGAIRDAVVAGGLPKARVDVLFEQWFKGGITGRFNVDC